MNKPRQIKPPALPRRLRDAASTLRYVTIPTKDLIPLLLEAADRIDELTTPNNDDEEDEDSRC